MPNPQQTPKPRPTPKPSPRANITPASSRGAPALQSRSASFAPGTAKDDRTIELVWTTEDPATVFCWEYGEIREKIDLKSADLSRLNAGAPLLMQHNTYDDMAQVGVVERAWIAGDEGRALVRFSSRPSVDEIWHDVRTGIRRGVSVGYKVPRHDVIDEEGGGRLYVAKGALPYEISFVSVPADPRATTRQAPGTKRPTPRTKEGKRSMLTPEKAKAKAEEIIAACDGDTEKTDAVALLLMSLDAQPEAEGDAAPVEMVASAPSVDASKSAPPVASSAAHPEIAALMERVAAMERAARAAEVEGLIARGSLLPSQRELALGLSAEQLAVLVKSQPKAGPGLSARSVPAATTSAPGKVDASAEADALAKRPEWQTRCARLGLDPKAAAQKWANTNPGVKWEAA